MMKKLISMLTVCVMICSIITGCATNAKNDDTFTAWVNGAEPVAALKEYVEDVTNEKSENFIPVEHRIAVFDLDGTLYCETFPIYGEWLLFADYVLNTPDYEASEEIMAVAQELSEIKKASDIPSHMEQTHIHAHAAAFAGMTIEEYMNVVEDFKKTNADIPTNAIPPKEIRIIAQMGKGSFSGTVATGISSIVGSIGLGSIVTLIV